VSGDVGIRSSWTLDEGLQLLRTLRPEVLKAGWAPALGGSLAYKGSSEKDADIILFPMSADKVNFEALYSVLNEFGLKRVYDKDQMIASWRERGSTDTKHVEVWTLGTKRVDFIILTR
jgi:hypothetical protein